METKAIAKWVRISTQRAQLVAREVQGKPVGEALDMLRFAKGTSAFAIRKTLSSAVANAENNFSLNVDKLVVKEVRIDQGPQLRRMKPRSRGRADVIRRPTSHITVVISESGGD